MADEEETPKKGKVSSGPSSEPAADLSSEAGRPDPRAFLAAVLEGIEELPAELPGRMSDLLDSENRAADIRDLFEELTR